MLKIFPIWAWKYAWWYTLFQNSCRGLILSLIWIMQWSLLNIWIWKFNWVWHGHCDGLFNICKIASSLILMFHNRINIFVCDNILFTWFGKKWKRSKKFWDWKICLVYAYFFKKLSLSMLITFILIKKSVVMQIMKLNKINNNYNILTTIK